MHQKLMYGCNISENIIKKIIYKKNCIKLRDEGGLIWPQISISYVIEISMLIFERFEHCESLRIELSHLEPCGFDDDQRSSQKKHLSVPMNQFIEKSNACDKDLFEKIIKLICVNILGVWCKNHEIKNYNMTFWDKMPIEQHEHCLWTKLQHHEHDVMQCHNGIPWC